MRVLVISGGGSKAAFGGGVAEYLMSECKKEYDLYIGTSVGSLLVPLLSIGKIDELKHIFSSVKQTDIFNTCPFIIYKNNGINMTQINHLGIIKSLLRGKKSFGETLNLRKLIQKSITENDFERMLKNKPEILITVSNLTTNTIEYKSLKDCTYSDFCDWVWASSNLVPFMSLVTKNGYEYGDGGMGNIVPIYEALKRGACEIDIILLNTEKNEVNKPPVHNALELTGRSFDFMLNQIVIDDIVIGMLEGMQRQVNLTFYRPPNKLTDNALIFDAIQMKQWWLDGYTYAKNSPHGCKSISTTGIQS